MSDKTTFGAHPLVCRFLQGVLVAWPSLPIYKTILDVNIVQKYPKQLHTDKDLMLQDLTLKLSILLALLSGQRCQTPYLLNLEDMNLTAQQGTVRVSEPIKTTKPGSKALQLKFIAYLQSLQILLGQPYPLLSFNPLSPIPMLVFSLRISIFTQDLVQSLNLPTNIEKGGWGQLGCVFFSTLRNCLNELQIW